MSMRSSLPLGSHLAGCSKSPRAQTANALSPLCQPINLGLETTRNDALKDLREQAGK